MNPCTPTYISTLAVGCIHADNGVKGATAC